MEGDEQGGYGRTTHGLNLLLAGDIMKTSRLAMAAAIACLGAAGADASTAKFVGSSGALAASVAFETSGSDLFVTLTNTGTRDARVPSDVLTAVFFDIDAVLTPLSAVLAHGSTVLFGRDGGGNVGGEWAYATGLSDAPASTGISSAGLGLFGRANFGGPNLEGGQAVANIQYGIVPAGDDPSDRRRGMTWHNALIKNAVVFCLSGLADDFDPLTDIANVSFQYGDSLRAPNVRAMLDDPPPPPPAQIPAPSTLGLLALGMLAARRPGRRARGSAKH